MKKSILLVALILAVQTLRAGAQVVARYTFDGRVEDGEVFPRLVSQFDPFPGEDYEPDAEQGESGPRLVNVGGGGSVGYYRSYYNHSGSEEADGREVLEMQMKHPHFLDIYQTAEGEGPLPAGGSFTWEAVVRIDEFNGASHMGVLIDASRGAGRAAGLSSKEGPDKTIATRLWMKPVEGDETNFKLCFTVPVNEETLPGDARGQPVTLSTELKYGQWYHLAAVYDDENWQARIYVDGEEAASAEVHSATDRATGFAIAGYGPEVFRIDHQLSLHQAFIDSIAFSKGALEPGQWSLKSDQEDK